MPNRSAATFALESSLSRAHRRGTGLAALFVDLDEFKRINDTNGQAVGDEVLRETARRLAELARAEDTVARLGSDEFLVIAEGIESIHQAVNLAERIRDRIAEPFRYAGQTIVSSASVGISLTLDAHSSGDELIREADLAVHRAKGFGQSRVEIFDGAMREQVDTRAQIEADLVQALKHHWLTVHLQPVTNSETLRIEGFEALVRWKDRQGNFIPPDVFIPVAESSNLILELDRYVIRKATAELASWPVELFGELHVAINVSGRHLLDRSVVRDVAEAMNESGLDPSRLILEITETVLLSDMPVACGHLEELRAMGVTIALDDFGSGYTSLATLRYLPVDILKIDRSIVNELQPDRGQSLVRLIIEAAHEFGMTVIAEGVETDMQRELLCTRLRADPRVARESRRATQASTRTGRTGRRLSTPSRRPGDQTVMFTAGSVREPR
ncbi:MAG: bifunctional diguanylate cyclase/phosphodiesterase [Ilumatobacteraceae bacterium]